MGSYQSLSKINYEDVINLLNTNSPNNVILLNTLNDKNQHCLIINTLHYTDEETILNKSINDNKSILVVIYGMNYSDETIYIKYNQLLKLGFTNVYIYPGGMFEWLLLQDIYGDEMFKTTSKELDILIYKPLNAFTKKIDIH
jgi:rhodanese-related sulfurtransferase